MTTTTEESHAGIGFALVFGASLATGVGASVVFFPKLVKLADHRVLASSLGFAAGIMGYVSFVEIFPKSRIAFEDDGFSVNQAFNFASLCFFGGVVTMIILNQVVHKIAGHKHRDHCASESAGSENVDIEVQEQAPRTKGGKSSAASTTDISLVGLDDDWGFMCLPGTADELEFLKYIASTIPNEPVSSIKETSDEADEQQEKEECRIEDHAGDKEQVENRKLLHMGLLTAIAIALHNFPEGLATFVAVQDDPSVGAVLAMAIAIHNVPEGLCVALPVYYATGSRRKAFMWGSFSGMTEVLAAFVGWLILSNSYSKSLFGALFGMVAGMMVMITIRELLPTAHRYDPQDKFVTLSFISGMLVIGLSLVLFRI